LIILDHLALLQKILMVNLPVTPSVRDNGVRWDIGVKELFEGVVCGVEEAHGDALHPCKRRQQEPRTLSLPVTTFDTTNHQKTISGLSDE
jgi:hypothetical protein